MFPAIPRWLIVLVIMAALLLWLVPGFWPIVAGLGAAGVLIYIAVAIRRWLDNNGFDHLG